MHHKKRNPKEYIHYGSDVFDINHKLSGERFDKPSGFWASPVVSNYYSWYDFCMDSDFRTQTLFKSFVFTLKPKSRILKVHNISDISEYIKYDENIKGLGFNHKKLNEDFDGMEVFMSGDLRDTNIFYTWDVDSLVIWNLNCIVVKKERN